MMYAVEVAYWGWFALGVFLGAALTLIWFSLLPDQVEPMIVKVAAPGQSDITPDLRSVDVWGSPLDGYDEIQVVGEWSDPELDV